MCQTGTSTWSAACGEQRPADRHPPFRPATTTSAPLSGHTCGGTHSCSPPRVRQNMTLASTTEGSGDESLRSCPDQHVRAPAASVGRGSYRIGIAPNVDTLYSVAWVDLAGGPVVLETPDFSNRYYTFQVGFADSSSIAVGSQNARQHAPIVTLRRRDTPGALDGRPAPDEPHAGLRCWQADSCRPDSAGGGEDNVHRLQDEVRLTRWCDGVTSPCTVDRPGSHWTPAQQGVA